MHQIVFRLGLRTRPHWGSLQRSLSHPLAGSGDRPPENGGEGKEKGEDGNGGKERKGNERRRDYVY